MGRLRVPANWSIVGAKKQTLKFLFRNDLVRVVDPASTRVWPNCAADDRVRGQYRQYSQVMCVKMIVLIVDMRMCLKKRRNDVCVCDVSSSFVVPIVVVLASSQDI